MQQSPQRAYEETFLLFFKDGPAEGAHDPRQTVQRLKREEFGGLLAFDLSEDKLLHFRPVDFDEESSQFPHDFIDTRILSVLNLFSNGVALFVDHNEHFFGFGHLQGNDLHGFQEKFLVDVMQGRLGVVGV